MKKVQDTIRLTRWVSMVCIALAVVPQAKGGAIWQDDFESYAAPSGIDGQGGWSTINEGENAAGSNATINVVGAVNPLDPTSNNVLSFDREWNAALQADRNVWAFEDGPDGSVVLRAQISALAGATFYRLGVWGYVPNGTERISGALEIQSDGEIAFRTYADGGAFTRVHTGEYVTWGDWYDVEMTFHDPLIDPTMDVVIRGEDGTVVYSGEGLANRDDIVQLSKIRVDIAGIGGGGFGGYRVDNLSMSEDSREPVIIEGRHEPGKFIVSWDADEGSSWTVWSSTNLLSGFEKAVEGVEAGAYTNLLGESTAMFFRISQE